MQHQACSLVPVAYQQLKSGFNPGTVRLGPCILTTKQPSSFSCSNHPGPPSCNTPGQICWKLKKSTLSPSQHHYLPHTSHTMLSRKLFFPACTTVTSTTTSSLL